MSLPVNFLVWNIRCISQVDFAHYLKELCIYHRIQLLVVIEPITNDQHLQRDQLLLGFDYGRLFIGGKIWVF